MVNPRNLLPDQRAGMVGWFDVAGAVHPDNGDGTLTTTGVYDAVATSPVVDGVATSPIPVLPGRWYTAAVDVSELAVVVLQWVGADGTVGERLTGYGTGRAAVSGVAPDTAAGVVVAVWPGVVTAEPNPDDPGTLIVSFPAGLRPAGMPLVIVADRTPQATMTVAEPVLVRSRVDPGRLPDDDADDSLGWRMYAGLPDVYRLLDAADRSVAAGRPLWQFVKGATTPADDVRTLMTRIAAGDLTDPGRADDRWVGWAAQILGVPAVGSATDIRAALTAQHAAPAPGTAAALAATVRPMLTGTRTVDVRPGSAAFTIVVRVRTDELGLVGDDPAVLRDRVAATGQVPAGFVVSVTTTRPTWAQVDAATGSWADTDGADWSDVDARGL
jgi:hypothetical protein